MPCSRSPVCARASAASRPSAASASRSGQGETLGLIGPNGAGKTTTFELLAGFTGADEGVVRYAGRDVTSSGPEARGRMGLIRSFQDAALFPTLTVLECVQLALERVDPTRLVPSLLGLKGQEKRKLARAEELVAWMGLERYRGSQIQELSTGTRRITEIACLVALEPQLLLLDEPSSGVAQKETEALGALLVKLKAELGLTLIIIEHDIPLIMGLSDRIICMADGEVIAAGSPAHVRHDPAVVEAYLGGSVTAIERSAGHGGGAPVATVQHALEPHGDELDLLLDDVLDEHEDDPATTPATTTTCRPRRPGSAPRGRVRSAPVAPRSWTGPARGRWTARWTTPWPSPRPSPASGPPGPPRSWRRSAPWTVCGRPARTR